MGLLEDWDRRNQRTADWQLHSANERLKKGRSLRWPVVAGLGLSVVLLRRILSHFVGFEWTMTVLLTVSVGCFVGVVVQQRRKRRAWEAGRSQES